MIGISVNAPTWFWLTWVPAGLVGLAGEWLSWKLLDYMESGHSVPRRPTLEGWLLAGLMGWIMILRLLFVPFLLLMAFIFTADLRSRQRRWRSITPDLQ